MWKFMVRQWNEIVNEGENLKIYNLMVSAWPRTKRNEAAAEILYDCCRKYKR